MGLVTISPAASLRPRSRTSEVMRAARRHRRCRLSSPPSASLPIIVDSIHDGTPARRDVVCFIMRLAEWHGDSESRYLRDLRKGKQHEPLCQLWPQSRSEAPNLVVAPRLLLPGV